MADDEQTNNTKTDGMIEFSTVQTQQPISNIPDVDQSKKCVVTKDQSVSYKLSDQEIDNLMVTVNDMEPFENEIDSINQCKPNNDDNHDIHVNEYKINHIDDDQNIDDEFDDESDSNILKQTSADIQLKIENKVGSNLMYSAYFWIRIFILILSIILIMLSLSYTFGAISSTELVLIDQCPGLSLEEIWKHSEQIGDQNGDKTGCWTTSRFKIDENNAYLKNIYQYQSKHDNFAFFQCAIFGLFTFCSVCIFIYGAYLLIIDIIATKQQILYTKSYKFRNYLKNVKGNSPKGQIINQKKQHPIFALFQRWKFKYDEYFGVDTNGNIARMIVMEIWEVILQTLALLLFNGYNVWDPNGVYLAYNPDFIILFVCILSFNCLVVGILWLFYVFRKNKCNGLIFNVSSFCIDQFSDLFYAVYPFIVVFGDPYNEPYKNDGIHPVWIGFGLLNNKTWSAFIYSAFPMILLCIKCFLMTRKTTRGMRGKSYDQWLFITKIMNTSNDKNQSKKQTEGKQKNNTMDTNHDEIYDEKGNLKLNVLRSGDDKTNSIPKSKKCRISIAMFGILFIIYSIMLLSVVINHMIESKIYCNNASNQLDIISVHPELYVYPNCNYKVYPFSFDNDISHNCQCRVLQLNWENITISEQHINNKITQISIIDNVLSKYIMLEKFQTLRVKQEFNNRNNGSFINHDGITTNAEVSSITSFELKASHFRATEMKLFSWSDIDIIRIDESISNWKHLEFFTMERVDGLTIFPSTFSELVKLKAFTIKQMNSLELKIKYLCNMKEMILINIRGTKAMSIPHCIGNLQKLEELFVQNSGLAAFPLTLLNMTKLIQLDLWGNGIIKYENILSYNNITNISNPFKYYINSSIDINVYLNGIVCEQFVANATSKGFEEWIRRGAVCSNQQCADSVLGEICTPSALGNGRCDEICNTAECNYDMADCYQFCFTKTECNYDQFLNEDCDEQCNNEYCIWDNGNCNNIDLPTNSPTIIGNGSDTWIPTIMYTPTRMYRPTTRMDPLPNKTKPAPKTP